MPRTKIRRLRLRGYQQFEDTLLDFTHPETGRALDRVCFIGPNGTGKSTVLRVLDHVLSNLVQPRSAVSFQGVEVEHGDERFVHFCEGYGRAPEAVWIGRPAEDLLGRPSSAQEAVDLVNRERLLTPAAEAMEVLRLRGPRDVIVYSPVDVGTNQGAAMGGMPNTSLSASFTYRDAYPVRHLVSDDHIDDMWNLLMWRITKRESDRREFELQPENQDRTKRELVREFDLRYPDPLAALAELWRPILEPAGLFLDVARARLPSQLNENLEAWVRHQRTGQNLGYGALSTGMRHFLFRVGHLFLLYVDRLVERGFVLVDEPENSLFPDFLFHLVDAWNAILWPPGHERATQLFVATHNPIVAAQFEPWERVILDWTDEGGVGAKRGVAPKGDDPNDVLLKDFAELRNRL